MTKPKRQQAVATCLQCTEDEILEKRKHASEAFECMGLLDEAYCMTGKRFREGTTIVDAVQALIEADRDLKRLQAARREEATRKVREIGDLKAACRFVGDSCNYGSGAVSLTGSGVTLDMSRVFRQIESRLGLIEAGYRGLLDGIQKQNERDHIGELLT